MSDEVLRDYIVQSMGAGEYGDFLIAILNEWVRHDVGKVYVMNFEWALASYMGLPSTVCLFAENCGNVLIVEHKPSKAR